MGDSVLLYAAYTGSGQSGKYNDTMPYFYNAQWNILYYVYLGILLQKFIEQSTENPNIKSDIVNTSKRQDTLKY